MLTVPYDRQETTRHTEQEVNLMFETWRVRFPGKSDRELLAMIAFRYADRYFALLAEREETMRDAEILGRRLDALLEGESING